MEGLVQLAATPQLTLTGVATARTAAQLRQELAEWLELRGVSHDQIRDILLSVNEALANCVDHAYRDRERPDTMTIRGDHQRSTGCLSLCITDHGTWCPPEPASPLGRRGRGITLMHALAANCTVNGRPDGTVVCLDFACSEFAENTR